MLKAFMNIFKVPDLRKKALFTIGILVLSRVGYHITVPGVNAASLLAQSGNSGAGLLEMLSLLTGGGLSTASVFSLGVMPYITAMIILQLLKSVVPSIDQMLKEGPEGRRKFQQIGRVGTLAVTLIQGTLFGISFIHRNAAQGQQFLMINDTMFVILFVLSVTAGTLTLMWMGEQITERGIGNGISLLIMAGIIARLPGALFQLFRGDTTDPMNLLIVIVLFFVIIGLVVFEETGLRRIPIQYTRRQVAGSSFNSQMSFLPFKVNPTGVIPIIFASAILTFPAMIANRFPSAVGLNRFVQTYLSTGAWLHSLIYFLMIIFFAYFYTEIELNPHNIAESLRKQGGFIPGIRPGSKTEEYIWFVLNRITLPGAVFLGSIALIPTYVIKWLNIPSSLGYLMGGTSLLIMVGVAIDTLKQVESHLLMHHMDGFFTKLKKKI